LKQSQEVPHTFIISSFLSFILREGPSAGLGGKLVHPIPILLAELQTKKKVRSLG
jgi:hypothetical protein